ncbi:hypothetical protein Tco_1268219 [Tanacetum coccineum]
MSSPATVRIFFMRFGVELLYLGGASRHVLWLHERADALKWQADALERCDVELAWHADALNDSFSAMSKGKFTYPTLAARSMHGLYINELGRKEDERLQKLRSCRRDHGGDIVP